MSNLFMMVMLTVFKFEFQMGYLQISRNKTIPNFLQSYSNQDSVVLA